MGPFASTTSAACSLEQLEGRSLMTATIAGAVFQDVTGNGLSWGDKPMAGVIVNLHKDLNGNGKLEASDGAPIATKTSNGLGIFAFAGLAKGQYLVREIEPANSERTGPTLSGHIAVNVTNKNGFYGNNFFANYVKTFDRTALTGIYYVINGKTKVTTLLNNVKEGDTVTAHFTVKAGKKVQVSLVSYKAIAPYSTAENLQYQDLHDLRTGTFCAGSHCLTIKVPNCYFQVDFVGGAAIDPFGPAGSNILYGAQDRLISYANGGTKPCECKPTPTCWDNRKDKCDNDRKDRCDDKDDEKDKCDDEKKNQKCDDKKDKKDNKKDRKNKGC
jgi:hypothetical protein